MSDKCLHEFRSKRCFSKGIQGLKRIIQVGALKTFALFDLYCTNALTTNTWRYILGHA